MKNIFIVFKVLYMNTINNCSQIEAIKPEETKYMFGKHTFKPSNPSNAIINKVV